jgi:hypothetical protein
MSILHKTTRPAAAREVRVDLERVGLSGEDISQIYAEQSKAGCLYARMMGQADYRTAAAKAARVVAPFLAGVSIGTSFLSHYTSSIPVLYPTD